MMQQGSVQADAFRSKLQCCVRAYVGRRIRDLQVETDGDYCLLRGHAPSYYVKQLAQAAVLREYSFRELRNQIVVGLTEREED